MGCLTADISRVTQNILPTITRKDALNGMITSRREPLRVKVGMVCSVPESMAIRFAKSNLVWEGDTNTEGVILYNTLISTGEWSLEEITIEELL